MLLKPTFEVPMENVTFSKIVLSALIEMESDWLRKIHGYKEQELQLFPDDVERLHDLFLFYCECLVSCRGGGLRGRGRPTLEGRKCQLCAGSTHLQRWSESEQRVVKALDRVQDKLEFVTCSQPPHVQNKVVSIFVKRVLLAKGLVDVGQCFKFMGETVACQGIAPVRQDRLEEGMYFGFGNGFH